MKFLSKTMLASSALVAMAGAALAQDFTTTGNSTFRVARGYVTPTTTLQARPVRDTQADFWAYHVCGTAVSLSLIQRLSDGTTLASQTVACDTTARGVSFTAPVPFEAMLASPTTTVSATSGVSLTYIETKK